MKLKHICILLIAATASMTAHSIWRFWNTLGGAAAETKTILRMAVPYPSGHPSVDTAEFFAGQVEEKTEGRIQICVYPNSRLGKEESTIEQLKFGGIAFSTVCTLALPEGTAILETFPATDSDGREQKISSGVKEMLVPNEDLLNQQMLQVLAVYEPDSRCIANSRMPMKTDADGVGLSIQAYDSDILTERLQGMGLKVVLPSGGSLDSSLNNGYIDGTELAFMEYSAGGYGDILPYLYLYDALPAPDIILASQVSMGNLSSDDQKIILSCAQQAKEYQQKILAVCQKKAMEECGMTSLVPGEWKE